MKLPTFLAISLLAALPCRAAEGAAKVVVETVGAMQGFFEEGPFQQPSGLFYDTLHHELFACDMAARRIAIANERAVPTYSVGSDRYFVSPHRLVVDRDGRLLVLDSGAPGVRVLDYDGTVLPDLDLSRIPAAESPARLSGIALSPEGVLYLLDVANHRVIVIEPGGAVRAFGPPRGRVDLLRNPLDVDLSPEGNLVIADGSGLAVQVFEPSGAFVRGWGKHEVGPAEFSLPGGLAVDGDGLIFIADTLRHDVKVFRPDGEFVTNFGGFGVGPGALRYPVDVASDKAGRVFVSERVGRRVQVFRVQSR